jgi:hypothetical protein
MCLEKLQFDFFRSATCYPFIEMSFQVKHFRPTWKDVQSVGRNFFGKEYLSSILSGIRVGCFEEFNTNVTNDKTAYLILVNNWVKLKHNFFGKEYLSSILSGTREGCFK